MYRGLVCLVAIGAVVSNVKSVLAFILYTNNYINQGSDYHGKRTRTTKKRSQETQKDQELNQLITNTKTPKKSRKMPSLFDLLIV